MIEISLKEGATNFMFEVTDNEIIMYIYVNNDVYYSAPLYNSVKKMLKDKGLEYTVKAFFDTIVRSCIFRKRGCYRSLKLVSKDTLRLHLVYIGPDNKDNNNDDSTKLTTFDFDLILMPGFMEGETC
jgi:hypothetical protein